MNLDDSGLVLRSTMKTIADAIRIRTAQGGVSGAYDVMYYPKDMPDAIAAIPLGGGGGGDYYTITASADKIANLSLSESDIAAIQSADQAGICAGTLQFDPDARPYAAFCGLFSYVSADQVMFTGGATAEGQPRASENYGVASITTTGTGFSITDAESGEDTEKTAQWMNLPVKLTVYLPTGSGGGGGISEWIGTQAQYDAMESHSSATYYAIVEEA